MALPNGRTTLEKGDAVLAQFPGADEWHYERLLLGLVKEGNWATLRAERRMFLVELPALRALRYFPFDKKVPPDLDRANVRLFSDSQLGALTVQEFVDAMQQGEVVVNNAKLRLGIPIIPVEEKQEVWVVAEMGPHFGEEMTPDEAVPNRRDRALVTTDEGVCLLLERIEPQNKTTWKQEKIKLWKDQLLDLTKDDDPDDIRVCKARFESLSGERWGNFKDGVEMMSEEAFEDFPLNGPRTFLWLCR